MHLLLVLAAIALQAVGPEERPAGRISATADPVRLTVAASGDFLIHEPVWERARADGGGGTTTSARCCATCARSCAAPTSRCAT